MGEICEVCGAPCPLVEHWHMGGAPGEYEEAIAAHWRLGYERSQEALAAANARADAAEALAEDRRKARDVQDYEAQAREVWASCLHDGDSPSHEPIAAALRAEREAALQASIDACDDAIGALQGDREVEAALECIKRIRALIAPAPESPPGPAAYVDALQDPVHATPGKLLYSQPLRPPAPSQAAPTEPQPPRWRIGRHYGIHVYCGETPIATFHTVDAATAAVRAYNASLDQRALAPSKEPPP